MLSNCVSGARVQREPVVYTLRDISEQHWPTVDAFENVAQATLGIL
jgi:hypothetical protein